MNVVNLKTSILVSNVCPIKPKKLSSQAADTVREQTWNHQKAVFSLVYSRSGRNTRSPTAHNIVLQEYSPVPLTNYLHVGTFFSIFK